MLESILKRLNDSEARTAEISSEIDKFFLIVMAIVIFFMQCGFAFLEAGSVRSKNTVNILIKNMLDAFIGGVSYWAIGWGLAYGDGGNPFCGGSQYFNYQLPYDQYPKWFFQFVFAATAATIVSGAIAERCQFFAYFAYSIILTGWVYPPVSHWAWDGSGWLAQLGFYKDFAGSGVVHLLGATCAIVGCYFIGPRRGRFSTTGKPIDMPGHSVPLAGLGGFILIFGFLAFNGGSQTQISAAGDGSVVALAIVNTILGAATGGMTVLFVNKFALKQPWSFLMTLNGALVYVRWSRAGHERNILGRSHLPPLEGPRLPDRGRPRHHRLGLRLVSHPLRLPQDGGNPPCWHRGRVQGDGLDQARGVSLPRRRLGGVSVLQQEEFSRRPPSQYGREHRGRDVSE